jgi:hypothetical protein
MIIKQDRVGLRLCDPLDEVGAPQIDGACFTGILSHEASPGNRTRRSAQEERKKPAAAPGAAGPSPPVNIVSGSSATTFRRERSAQGRGAERRLISPGSDRCVALSISHQSIATAFSSSTSRYRREGLIRRGQS